MCRASAKKPPPPIADDATPATRRGIDGFEESARIVGAFHEAVFDDETLQLLTDIAKAIPEDAFND